MRVRRPRGPDTSWPDRPPPSALRIWMPLPLSPAGAGGEARGAVPSHKRVRLSRCLLARLYGLRVSRCWQQAAAAADAALRPALPRRQLESTLRRTRPRLPVQAMHSAPLLAVWLTGRGGAGTTAVITSGIWSSALLPFRRPLLAAGEAATSSGLGQIRAYECPIGSEARCGLRWRRCPGRPQAWRARGFSVWAFFCLGVNVMLSRLPADHMVHIACPKLVLAKGGKSVWALTLTFLITQRQRLCAGLENKQ